eukprot:682518-Rhodomonas_salina.3
MDVSADPCERIAPTHQNRTTPHTTANQCFRNHYPSNWQWKTNRRRGAEACSGAHTWRGVSDWTEGVRVLPRYYVAPAEGWVGVPSYQY